jgi:hypothetical protein
MRLNVGSAPARKHLPFAQGGFWRGLSSHDLLIFSFEEERKRPPYIFIREIDSQYHGWLAEGTQKGTLSTSNISNMLPLFPRANQIIVTPLDHLENKVVATIEDLKAISYSTPSLLTGTLENDTYPTCKVKRTLRFSKDLNLIQPTIHIRDYTFRERRATWYNLSDLKRFKKDRRATIKRMNEGLNCKGYYCTIGLERSTEEAAKMRYQIVKESIEAVMNEQKLQEMNHSRNPEKIAKAYIVHSLPCQMAVYERGLGYQEAVKVESESNVQVEQLEDVADYIEKTCSFLMESAEHRDDSPEEAVVCWTRC